MAVDEQHIVLSSLKGLALSTAFMTSGHLLSSTTINVPSLYLTGEYSHRLAAQQFALGYHRTTSTVLPTAEYISATAAGILSYISFQHNGPATTKWRVWAAASIAILGIGQWSAWKAQRATKKLLWVAEVTQGATKMRTPQQQMGPAITVQDTDSKIAGRLAGGDVSGAGAANSGIITPLEQFEPFEDAIVGEEYEQLKVKKLLQHIRFLDSLRLLGSLTSGVLGLWATFSAV